MKVSILALAAVSMAAGAQTSRTTTFEPIAPTPLVSAVPAPTAPHLYALPQSSQRSVVQAPSWFVRLPEDTVEMTFAVGTATSTDEQMAYDKARMAAERKLVEQMYARISTQTNSFRADRGQGMIENFQQVTRKNARGELSGAQRVDSQVTHDGRVYKVYVLLRLPLGEANVQQTRRDQARLQREATVRGRAAEREMDANDARDEQRERDADRALERSLAPPVAPATAPGTESVPTSQGEFRLLDVDNEEYKRRRAEALAKPGAVIGQITVR